MAACETYCPLRTLDRFSLLMAGHGRCVRTAMMLGDRDYARAQLAVAEVLGDEELAGVARELAEYFQETA